MSPFAPAGWWGEQEYEGGGMGEWGIGVEGGEERRVPRTREERGGLRSEVGGRNFKALQSAV